MKYVCIWLIRFYRKVLSPLKRRPCCRFVPTCSTYALEAFQKRGFFIGMILTIKRLLRCNRFFPGGYDPVPEKGLRYKGSREIPLTHDLACCEEHGEPRREDDDVGTQEVLECENNASYKENGEA